MTDAWTQRHDDEAFEDEQDRQRERCERADRLIDYAPIEACRDCGTHAVEVETGRWECACGRVAA